MVETRLSVGAPPSNTHPNPVGAKPIAELNDRLYNHSDYPIHQIQQDYGVNWIVIDDGIVHYETNVYYTQIRQPNGDIYLKQIDLFSSKNIECTQVSQQAGDNP